jgi:TRAP-type C4-dicarboxylate transport system permease small subunit
VSAGPAHAEDSDMTRHLLDGLYRLAMGLSALCLVAIAVLVGLQLAGRILDGALWLIGLPPYGFVILSLAEIAGFLLAAASFFALAGTLKAGAHIRVTMVLSWIGERARHVVELWAFGSAAAFSAYMTWHIASFAFVSWKFNEVSSGLVPVQLAYPQAAMAVGMVVLTISLVDELVIVYLRGRPSFRAAEDAITLGKEG